VTTTNTPSGTPGNSPFPFPTDDHPMFPSATQTLYDAAIAELQQQYQDALDRINEEWQMAVDRARREAVEPDQGIDYRNAPQAAVDAARAAIRTRR
jgi:cation transport regulator ChaB